MKKLKLFIPESKDYWYLSELQSNPQNMSYNAGFDVTYAGYHYETGCIDLPEEKWESEYQRKQEKGIFIAYIKDESLASFVGYVSLHYDEKKQQYNCGILIDNQYRGNGYEKDALRLLIEYAKGQGINTLYDSFEKDRTSAIKLFLSTGFKIVEEYNIKKFNKDTKCILVKKEL